MTDTGTGKRPDGRAKFDFAQVKFDAQLGLDVANLNSLTVGEWDEAVVALVEVVEAAREVAAVALPNSKSARLEEALSKFDFGSVGG